MSQPAKHDQEQSLSTLLDADQRASLTLLLASIISSMRQSLVDNFDPKAGLDQGLLQSEDLSNDEKLLAVEPSEVDVEQYDEQRDLQRQYEANLETPKMKRLKDESVSAFDQWGESVISRVGEVVNSRQTTTKQLKAASKDRDSGAAPKNEPDLKLEHHGDDEMEESKPSTTNIKIGKIMETPESFSKLKFKDIYPPTKNVLTKLSMDQRMLIMHSMLLLLLSLEVYSAWSRVLLLLLCSSLKLPLKSFEQDEYATAKGLLENVKELSAEEEMQKKAHSSKDSRKWKVGIATAAGAALIGVTGGLAAPLVAAGIGSIMGGLGLGATSAAAYLGSVAGSTYLIGGLFGAYGGRMTGQMMDNYAREVEDFQFLPLHHRGQTSENEEEGAKQASMHDHKLRVTIAISGWLTEKEDVLKPWDVLTSGADVFALKHSLEVMLNLGNAMNGFVRSAAWGYAKKKIIAQTIFADLALAMWPIGLMKAARVVDNPFNIAKNRSEKAGKVLADALINKAQGERPVTLIGYSLGARLIYSCLMTLAERGAFGIIENAVLIGAPTPSDTSDWRMLRSVVSGRLVNVYSTNDYVLGFMYRTSSLQYGVAGLQAIQGLPNIENVDVTEEVSGHLRYRYLIGSILARIGFEDVDLAAVKDQKEALRKMEEEERQQSLDSQQKQIQRREASGATEDEAADADREAGEIEKEVEARTQKSLVSKAFDYFGASKGSGHDGGANDLTVSAEAADTSKQTSGQSFSSWAYQSLPSLPHVGQSTKNSTQSKQERGEVSNPTVAKATTGENRSRASDYLPSIPKSLPSIPGFGARNSTSISKTGEKKGDSISQ